MLNSEELPPLAMDIALAVLDRPIVVILSFLMAHVHYLHSMELIQCPPGVHQVSTIIFLWSPLHCLVKLRQDLEKSQPALNNVILVVVDLCSAWWLGEAQW
jgi:hypothetical protein